MSAGRETKEFWLSDTDSLTVKKEIGYRCTPANPDMWFFPVAGYSIHESQCHTCRETAELSLRMYIGEQMALLKEAIAKLPKPNPSEPAAGGKE